MAQGHEATLSGIRVIELGHFVAAPFCTRLLADMGAEVIKVEPLGGDPIRQWGQKVNGHSAWWSVHARNKKLISLDLKRTEGVAIVKQLLTRADAVVENFRPGQLDRMGLSEAVMTHQKPNIIIARISGYGQEGPYRDRAAFGVIGEAIGGLRYLCSERVDETDRPPVRVGISLGDSLAGLYAAFGVVSALLQRATRGQESSGSRIIDVALTDSVLSFMEGLLPEYSACGFVRRPEGSRIATAAPSSAYPTADGQWLLIAANSDPLFAKLCHLMGQPGLASDPAFAGNANRVENVEALDRIIGAWTVGEDRDALEECLTEAGIPNSRIYDAADCAHDPQFLARGMVQMVDDPILGPVLHPGIVPHVPQAPGSIRWTGGALGSHTDEVLCGLLGHSQDQVAAFRTAGIIA